MWSNLPNWGGTLQEECVHWKKVGTSNWWLDTPPIATLAKDTVKCEWTTAIPSKPPIQDEPCTWQTVPCTHHTIAWQNNTHAKNLPILWLFVHVHTKGGIHCTTCVVGYACVLHIVPTNPTLGIWWPTKWRGVWTLTTETYRRQNSTTQACVPMPTIHTYGH